MTKKKLPYNTEELQEAGRKLTVRIREADKVDMQEIDASFRNVMGKVKKSRSRSKLHRIYLWTASAAALIGIVLVATWWQHGMDETVQSSFISKTMREITVPEGERMDILLSDGTKMYVNSGSEVVYPDVFDKDKREISVEGEVYLDVAKNPGCPFIVKTEKFDIRVLGTSFNIYAYKDNAASVVLVHGSVLVTTKNKQQVELKPNQLADIGEEGASVRQVDVSEYVSWKDNMLLVERKPVVEIFRKLELYYGCRIKYDPEIASMSLTGKLDLLPDIEDVIDNLCFSLALHYTINESKEIYVSLK